MDGLGVGTEIFETNADKGCRPIECFGNARCLSEAFLADCTDHAGNLQGQRRINPGQACQKNAGFAINIRKVDIVIQTPPPQSIGQFPRAVGGQHDERD